MAEGAVRVAEILEEVAEATREQRLGIDQITQGLEQVDQVTQANTAEAEESAAASEELSGQASELNRIVKMFRIAGSAVRSLRESDPDPSTVKFGRNAGVLSDDRT